MITPEDMAKALDRIARTADGELLYRWLQMKLMGVPDVDPRTEGALLVFHGERKSARDLMAMMAKGIEESGGRADHTGGTSPSERPVVFALRAPAFASQSRGAGRRVSIGPGEPGYSDPDKPDAA